MVVFKTKFDENVTSSINKQQLGKNKWLIVVLIGLFFIFGTIMLLTALEEYAYSNPDYLESLIISVSFYLIAILYYPLVKLFTKKLQKRINKTMKILSPNTVETYTFTSDRIKIESVNGTMYTENIDASYEYLYQVVESEEAFFLYISKMQTHVVSKKDIVEGDLIELCEYINNHFPLKRANGKSIIYARERR